MIDNVDNCEANKDEDIIILQDKETTKNSESSESDQIKEFNFPFGNDIDLEVFLSKKIDEFNELDNFIDNYEKNKKEDDNEIKEIVEELEYNERKKQKNKDIKGIKEILEIIRKSHLKKSPFKRLKKPKKFSLDGRILFNITTN